MLDTGIGTREEEGFMPTVPPPNKIGRCSIRSPNLEHFPVSIRLARMVPMDHDPITHAGLQDSLLYVHLFHLLGRLSFAASLGPKDPRIIGSANYGNSGPSALPTACDRHKTGEDGT